MIIRSAVDLILKIPILENSKIGLFCSRINNNRSCLREHEVVKVVEKSFLRETFIYRDFPTIRKLHAKPDFELL